MTQELEGDIGANDFGASGARSSGKKRAAAAGGQGGLSDQCQIHEVSVHCLMTLNSGPTTVAAENSTGCRAALPPSMVQDPAEGCFGCHKFFCPKTYFPQYQKS